MSAQQSPICTRIVVVILEKQSRHSARLQASPLKKKDPQPSKKYRKHTLTLKAKRARISKGRKNETHQNAGTALGCEARDEGRVEVLLADHELGRVAGALAVPDESGRLEAGYAGGPSARLGLVLRAGEEPAFFRVGLAAAVLARRYCAPPDHIVTHRVGCQPPGGGCSCSLRIITALASGEGFLRPRGTTQDLQR